VAGGDPEDLRDLVGELFRTRKKQPHLVVTLLRQHWAGIVGAEMARKTWPKRLAGETLWIAATDSGWAYQLQFMKGELLDSLAAFLERPLVTDLRFRVEPLPEAEPPPGATAAAPDEAAADPGVARAAGSIADVRLRESFVRALSRQTHRRSRDAAGTAEPSPPEGPPTPDD